MSDRNAYPPSVNVGRLYERTSSKGNVYLTGFFGTMKITALKSKDADAEGNPIWNLMIAAAPSRDRAGSQAGARSQTSSRTPMQSSQPTPTNDEIPF